MVAFIYIDIPEKFPKRQCVTRGTYFKALFMPRYTWIFACLFLMFTIVPTEARSAGYGQKNFLILDKLPKEDGVTLPDDFPPALRWRAVILNPAVIKGNRIKPGDELVLNLFPDTEYTARIERVDENIQGVVTVRGRVRDYPAGYIIITTTGDDTLAEIRIPQKKETYRIQSHPKRKFSYLLELDSEKLDIKEGAPPLFPPDN